MIGRTIGKYRIVEQLSENLVAEDLQCRHDSRQTDMAADDLARDGENTGHE